MEKPTKMSKKMEKNPKNFAKTSKMPKKLEKTFKNIENL